MNRDTCKRATEVQSRGQRPGICGVQDDSHRCNRLALHTGDHHCGCGEHEWRQLEEDTAPMIQPSSKVPQKKIGGIAI